MYIFAIKMAKHIHILLMDVLIIFNGPDSIDEEEKL